MVADVPTCEPPWRTRYPVTAVSSLDAVHESATDVWPIALVLRPVGVEGGVVSGQAAVVRLLVAVPETFPAASTAATPSV